MSDTGARPEVRVSSDGIDIRKSYETDEFPVPAVAFELHSTRDDEATVRLTDTVPEDVPPEDLGFHPDYGNEHWSIEDGDAVFERRFGPDERFQTVYGIRTGDHDPERFMTEPTLDVERLGEATDEPEATEEPTAEDREASDTDGVVGRDTTQAARDVISGDGDVSGLDDGDDGVEDVDISTSETTETGDVSEPTEPTTPTAGTADDAGPRNETSDGPVTDGTVAAGGVGAALAAELRDESLSEADRDLLAAEFTEEDAGSDVRISHLQSRISDLEAYTDALEEFIDENGPARKLIEDVTSQLEDIEDELEALDERTADNTDAVADLDERTEENAGALEGLEERTTDNTDAVADLDGRMTENETDIDALDKGVADAQAEIAETQESVTNLREDVAEIEEWRARISSVLGGVSETEDE